MRQVELVLLLVVARLEGGGKVVELLPLMLLLLHKPNEARENTDFESGIIVGTMSRSCTATCLPSWSAVPDITVSDAWYAAPLDCSIQGGISTRPTGAQRWRKKGIFTFRHPHWRFKQLHRQMNRNIALITITSFTDNSLKV